MPGRRRFELRRRTCHAAVPADIDVEIDASPNPTGWSDGCDSGGNATSPTCTLGMSNLRTLAFVSFDGQDPLGPPFKLTPTVKVKLGGSGQGHVTGSGIDCPGTCQVSADYQARIELQAQKSDGSTFVRWFWAFARPRRRARSAPAPPRRCRRSSTRRPRRRPRRPPRRRPRRQRPRRQRRCRRPRRARPPRRRPQCDRRPG